MTPGQTHYLVGYFIVFEKILFRVGEQAHHDQSPHGTLDLITWCPDGVLGALIDEVVNETFYFLHGADDQDKQSLQV